MIDQLTQAYNAAVDSMSGRPPRPLAPMAQFVATQTGSATPADVSLPALRAHLEKATPEDGLRRALHLVLAGWDGESTADWTAGSEPHTKDRRALVHRLLGFDDDTARTSDELFPVTGRGHVVISTEFEPWYTDDRKAAHNFYWRAYERLLSTDKSWDPTAVHDLDEATSRVVERLSDPTRQQAYQSKGLVVGYVQSGKTANFTGVLAKSIDAGYRLVIVLTGTIDLLRKQTQRRLDKELVGIENIFLGVDPDDPAQTDLARQIDYFQDEDRIAGRFISHGFQPSEHGFTDIVRLTRHDADYGGLHAGITALELEKRNKQKPLFDPENLYNSGARLAVVKKNAAVLRKLVRDLKSIRTRLSDVPTLIVDDESDQASVNTSDPAKWREGERQRTAINQLLSELLQLLPRAQYLGYTATPYANVFIDPGDTEDIFPKDYLISLDPPMGYMGLADFHDLDAGFDDVKTVANSNERAFVRDLHSPTADGSQAEHEMQQALDSFLLSGAIKLFREHRTDGRLSFRHHTMLVHESMRTAEHKKTADMVRQVWRRGQYMSPAGMTRLDALFQGDFAAVSRARAPELPFPADIDELRPSLGTALSRIHENGGDPVLVINADKDIQQQNLDFETGRVWRVLVGGAKLSRGFTVEGLTTSYFRRVTRQADALMQMGRWFGYRNGYRDLVRLFIGRTNPHGGGFDLYEAFEAVVRDEEAFRGQLRRYAELVDGRPQVTPRDIPPLVSQHLPAIKPASRNKMFNAELVVRRSPGQPVEPTGYPLVGDGRGIAANYRAMLPLLQAANEERALTFPDEHRKNPGGTVTTVRKGGRFPAFVGAVDARTLLAAMEQLRWRPVDHFQADLAYLREITVTQVDDWMVIAPQLNLAPIPLSGVGPRSVHTRRRRTGRDDLFGALSDPKHRPPAERVAGSRPGWGDATVEQMSGLRRGAVLVYPIRENDADAPDPSTPIVAFTLFAPRSAMGAEARVVQFRVKDSSAPAKPIIDQNEADKA